MAQSAVAAVPTHGTLNRVEPGTGLGFGRLPLADLVLGRPWTLVLAMVVGVYLLAYYVLPGRVSGVLIAQAFVPGMWLIVAGTTLWIARREGANNLVFTRKFLWIGLLIGVFQIAAYLVAGMFQGFGNSPYASSIPGMLTNFVYVGSTLIGMEIARGYLVTSLNKKGLVLIIGVVIILFAAVMIPPSRFATLDGSEVTIRFLGRFMVPNLSESLVTTLLALVGGPVAAIAYRGAMMGFEWFSPILPDLPWMTYFFLGTVPPMVGFLTIQSAYVQAERAVTQVEGEQEEKGSGIAGWIGTVATALLGVLLLAVILLNFGFMGFKSMVVISGSMSPAVNVGDLVISRAAPIDDMHVGDIVKYRRGGRDIVHRIIGVETVDGEIVLATRGDANNVADKQGLYSAEVLGKMVFRIPWGGWPTIWLSQSGGAR